MYRPLQPTKASRLFLISIGFLALFGVVITRLYLLQIVHADFFNRVAERQYATTITLPSQRGTIYDRAGRPLALSQHALSSFVHKDNMQDATKTEQILRDEFPAIWISYKDTNQHFFWIERNITPERKEELRALTPDIHFIHEPTRWYQPPYLPHVVGFTNRETHGLAGIERRADEALSGAPTTMHLQQDTDNTGLYFLHDVITPGSCGTDITLSIDQMTHYLLSHELSEQVNKSGATRGCTLVLDPDTGEVLAMAQAPTFDPHNPAAAAAAVRKNHALATCYEFGSAMHIFTGLAALAEQTTTADELIDCQGSSATIDGMTLTNPISLGTLPFSEVIAQSSDVGIATIGKRMGDKLYEHFTRLGFGSATGIELPGERAGFINPPERWSATSALSLSCGYEVMGTLMQLARGWCMIANGGSTIAPTLEKQSRLRTGFRAYDAQHTAALTTALTTAATQRRLAIPGYTFAARAGAGRMLVDGAYSETEHVHTCGGIIEKDGWRRVVVTFLEKPSRGGFDDAQHAVEQLCVHAARTTALHDMLHA